MYLQGVSFKLNFLLWFQFNCFFVEWFLNFSPRVGREEPGMQPLNLESPMENISDTNACKSMGESLRLTVHLPG